MKYTTQEERDQAQRENAKRWYARHKQGKNENGEPIEPSDYGKKNSYSREYHIDYQRRLRQAKKQQQEEQKNE
jgi:hypothetical protein